MGGTRTLLTGVGSCVVLLLGSSLHAGDVPDLGRVDRRILKEPVYCAKQPLYGLYPENRPSPAPTGARLLETFATLCIVQLHDGSGTHRVLGQFSTIQREILKLLELPSTALRIFKRRCGT